MVVGSQTWGEDSLRLGGGIPEVGGWAGAPTGWGGEERLLELEGEGVFGRLGSHLGGLAPTCDGWAPRGWEGFQQLEGSQN